ncbi:diguanylate cyclase [Parasulfuritortus cantonensis]|uniref:diguanylate cyclase n=1 Tax=Parasulfuritortus cantonensis TaxID=2528202 RepID=A0A4R1BL73_9PROT|nr:diguanylate cyclase [Parasulfuritortus cantonensis]TCJ18008.1 diguanylate cyclase [Parasulfuritortus cantonensis]
MPFPLDREKTQKLTEELENVIAAHLGWFKQFSRLVACGVGIEEFQACDDAYLKSPFGQWYYRDSPHPLTGHPPFQDMAEIQQALHAHAREVVDGLRAGRRPSVEQHDACVDLALKLNNKLRHLQLDVIGDLLTTDPLTGCYSRRGMINRLQAEQERAQRIERPCSLCLIDFDHFKRINDQYGHPAGDTVLKQGMRFVGGVLRKYDMVFRYGGEEFLLCLPATPADDAAQVIERIRSGLEKMPIMLPGRHRLHVTASFGIAEVADGQPVEDSIARADTALLTAKHNGRNRVEIWRGD